MENLKKKIAKRAKELVKILEISPVEAEKIEENLSFSYSAPKISKKTAANAIDHTILSFNAAEEDVLRICREARDFGFKAVCINPMWVKTAAAFRSENNAKFLIATVIDFPLGASTAAAKTAESVTAALDGADEIDVVRNIGLIKSRKLSAYRGLCRSRHAQNFDRSKRKGNCRRCETFESCCRKKARSQGCRRDQRQRNIDRNDAGRCRQNRMQQLGFYNGKLVTA